MSTKTRRPPHLEVVRADPAPCCAERERTQAARLHYEIGVRAFDAGLPVDWEYVAFRMARAMDGEDEEPRS